MNTELEGKELAFPRAEYELRLAAVRVEMGRRGLDALVLFEPENLFYLLGFESIGFSSFQLALVPIASEPQLLVREMEGPGALRSSWMSTAPTTVSDGEDQISAAIGFLRDVGADRGRLGIERTAVFCTAANYLAIVAGLAGVDLVDGSGIVESVRRVKSPAEIEYVRRAARYTEAGMRAAMAAIRAGVTENDVAAAAAAAIYSAGSEYMCSAPIVTGGPRSGIAHTTFYRRRLEAGDSVLVELGAVHGRYAGPLMRSAVLGTPSALIRDMYDTCRRALEAAIASIHPGVTSGSVHDACQRVIDAAGFTANFRKRLGYSVGVGFPPDWGEGHIVHLSRGDTTILEPGMVFHMPPALREYLVAGVGCSETILVTPDGVEVLTDYARELVVR